jgi:hypothetical protein
MLSNISEKTDRISIENELYPKLTAELEEYIKLHLGARLYHHPLYLKVLSLESRLPYSIIISRNGNSEINGFMYLLETRGISLGPRAVISSKRIASLPRSSISGPLTDDISVTASILETAKKLCDNLPGSMLQVKTNFDMNNVVSGFNSIDWRNTYIKKIPPAGENLNIKKNTKYDIKRSLQKADENNIKFREASSLKDFKDWYKLYLLVMRYHRVHARSFEFFKLCRDILKPAGMMQLNLAVIEKGNSYEVLSGNFNFIFRDIYLSGFKAGQMKRNDLLAGDFLVYNELLYMQEKGFQYYDLGETPDNHQNLIKYKLKWGSEPERVFHNFYGPKSHLVKKGLDFKGDTSLSTKIWRHVPLKITEIAGRIINSRL